jgi:hypothetical protein
MKEKKITDYSDFKKLFYGKKSSVYESVDSLIDYNLFPNESLAEMINSNAD